MANLDPRLELWQAPERMEPMYGVIPGYWHVVVNCTPPTPDRYLAITTDGLGVADGGFRYPDSGVLEDLKRNDMQGRHYTLPSDDIDVVEAAVQKERKRKSEQRGDQIVEDTKAIFRLPGDGGLEKRLWAKGAKKLDDKS